MAQLGGRRTLKTTLLVLRLLVICTPVSAINHDTSKMNSFIANVMGGSYASEAVEGVLQDLPVLGSLPTLFSLEDEADRFVQRETSRFARRMVHGQIHDMGIYGPLSYHSPSTARSSRKGSTGTSRERAKLRAHVSTRRIRLLLHWRFN